VRRLGYYVIQIYIPSTARIVHPDRNFNLHPVQSDSGPVVDVVLAGPQCRAGARCPRYHHRPDPHHAHLKHQRVPTKGGFSLSTFVTLKRRV